MLTAKGGSELEVFGLLHRLGRCQHTLMLMFAMVRGDATNRRLMWWREVAPLMLRTELGEAVGPIPPFEEDAIPEFANVKTNHEALAAIEKCRANLKRIGLAQARR